MSDTRTAPHVSEHAHGSTDEVFFPRHALARELASHLPFSVSSVALGLVLAGILSVVAVPGEVATVGDHDHVHSASGGFHRTLFHLFHPAHMLFSAAATTAMFWRYDRRMLRAIVVGMVGAIVVCGVSDIAIPALSAWILGKGFAWPWHICVIDHPGLVLPFAVVGIALGLMSAGGVQASTFFSHSLHVFASTMASIFYLVSRYATSTAWIDDIGAVFTLIILAVLAPCCLSDIVFPVLMSRPARKEYFAHGHAH